MPTTRSIKKIWYLSAGIVWIIALFVFSPGIAWMGKVFTGLDSLFNIAVMTFVIGLIALKYKSGDVKFYFGIREVYFLPLIVQAAGIISWYYFFHVLHLSILSAVSFLVFCYGFLGMIISGDSWKRVMIPFVLVVLALPFGQLIDIYIGFPLRMMAVDSLTQTFRSLGLSELQSSTIFLIENQATQIDLACSGLKGIWAGMLFYFAYSWLENYRLNALWFTGIVLLNVLLVASNIMRIFILVYLTTVLDMPETARMVHAPTGMLLFVMSCSIVYFYLYLFASSRENVVKKDSTSLIPLKMGPVWGQLAMVPLLIVNLIPGHTEPSHGFADLKLDLHSIQTIQPAALSKGEQSVFLEQDCLYTKFSFETKDVSGSALILKSGNWRGHHMPEYCMHAAGYNVLDIKTCLIGQDKPFKWLTLDNDLQGLYWFQSPYMVTDDYPTRVWQEIQKQDKNWIMVSVILNPLAGKNYDPAKLVQNLQRIIDQHFEANRI